MAQFFGFVALMAVIIYVLGRSGKRSVVLSDEARSRTLGNNQRRDAEAVRRAAERAASAVVYGTSDNAARERIRDHVALVNRPAELSDERLEGIRAATRGQVIDLQERMRRKKAA